ncbi:MAG: family 16 glycoside hydrolase, partial [Segetibacter sp.]
KADDFNHIKVECIGNEMKTWFNGVPCGYLVDTIDQRGFIALQVHAVSSPDQVGKKVWFKNIRIKTSGITPTPFPKGVYVVNYQPNTLNAYEKQEGWRLLFDGKTSNGWMSFKKTPFPDKGWAINDGTINVLKSEGREAANGGDIVTKDQFKAFDLSFEFRLTPGANSGLKYFVTLSENNKGSALGLEYQVLDDALHPDAKLGRNGDRTLSSLYDLIPANKPAAAIRPIGRWNIGRVVVHPDNKVEHYLNGYKVLEYSRGSAAFRDSVQLSKFKPVPNFGEAPQGYILLQDHGDAVSFRSIKIKNL